jgi:AraC-like DNA-binding protein
MKRKLKKHHTTFQQQIDMARKNTAIYLFQVKHFNNQQIAEYLRFNDMNNYRRAFKRWTGLSPYTLF